MRTILLVLCLALFPISLFAQELDVDRGELWISPGAEMSLYSISSAAYGGGMTIAYGRGASIGFKTAYFFDIEGEIDTLEVNVLLRFYFKGGASVSGPFIQFSGGPAFFVRRENSVEVPSDWGMISLGLNFGWRFLLGKAFFIEPSVRAGYPFIASAGFSAGVHF